MGSKQWTFKLAWVYELKTGERLQACGSTGKICRHHALKTRSPQRARMGSVLLAYVEHSITDQVILG